jgi:hypothetical protein
MEGRLAARSARASPPSVLNSRQLQEETLDRPQLMMTLHSQHQLAQAVATFAVFDW